VLSLKKRKLSQQSQRREESLLGTVISRLKTTSRSRKSTGVHKGFDPFTITWTDEGKALQEFCLFSKNILYPVLGPLFKVSPLATYKEDSILDLIMYMAINRVTSENGARAFKDEYNKGPSPRTIRYRLEKLKLSEVESAFLEGNKKILSFFRDQKKNKKISSIFKKKKKKKDNHLVLISVDTTHTPYYGKRKKYACSMKKDRGRKIGDMITW
jgi:hypothetical protein